MIASPTLVGKQNSAYSFGSKSPRKGRFCFIILRLSVILEMWYTIMNMLNIYNANNHDRPLEPGAAKPPAGGAVPTAKAKQPAYLKYQDPTGEFTTQQLTYSLWFVTHRVFLYRLLTGVLVVVGSVLWLFSLWQWGNYAIFGYSADHNLYRELSSFPDYTLFAPQLNPQPIQVLEARVLPGAGNKYDFVADVANTNERWKVRLSYHFETAAGPTPSRSTTLLPNENRLVTELGFESLGTPQGATIVLDQVTWQRIDPHVVASATQWQAEHLQFSATNFEFTPGSTVDGPSAQRITFTLVNQSSYGYKEARFLVGLYLQDGLVGVVPLTLNNLASLEQRAVDLRSFAESLTVNEVRLFPLIDVYDEDVFLLPAP